MARKNRLPRTAVLVAAELLAFYAAAGPSAGELPTQIVVSDDRLATCYDEQTGVFRGSMLVKSQVLVAPDGEHRAYTESLAAGGIKLPSKTGGGWLSPECASISQIFVADKGSPGFRRVLTITPVEDMLGNAIRLVDWSSDSRYLLSESVLFQWGSDFAGSGPVVYDAQSGISSDPELMYRAFKKWAGRDCVTSVKPLGFSSDAKVVVKAGPSQPVAPESGEVASNSCLKKPGTWLYDPENSGLAELPADYRVRHFGEFESNPARKQP